MKVLVERSKTVRQPKRGGGVGCESQTTRPPPPPKKNPDPMPTASSSHTPPCPLSMAPWRMMALHALEVQICVLTCSCALSACFPHVSGDRARQECSRITDTSVTLPNQIMETYWFFSQPLSFFSCPFSPRMEVAGAFRVTVQKLRQSSVVMISRSLLLHDKWGKTHFR